jgi:lipooligosaccharide transport system permease protein
MMNIWVLPRLSWRFVPVFRRNLLVWRKLALASMVGNIAEPLITLLAFGYGLGSLVGAVQAGDAQQAVPYILFLASGSICMSVMNASTFEALYSAFSRMHVQKTWDSIMNAPVALDDVVLAECLWAAFKSLMTGSAILLVIVALGISREPHLLLVLPCAVLVGMCFSALALVFNAMAKGYDFFTFYFTLVLMPMNFLSGVFFPREQMPAWLQQLAAVLPLSHAVDLIRPLFLGQWPAHAVLNITVLLLYTALGYWVALALTRRRFFG